jgi:DNA-binding LacI/PurR family transcriptional regulator
MLGAVLGIEDQYSSTFFQGVQQAATDFGITLQLESFDDFATLSSALLHQEMAARITTMCNKNIDGVVVRLPPDSSANFNAVEWCRKLAVPIIAIQEGNTDLVKQKELMTFIGVNAYKAGYQAGQKLLDIGSVEAWCIVDGEYTTTLTTIDATDTTNAMTTLTTSLTLNAQRCQGMEKAFEESFFVKYMGTIIIPPMKHDDDDYDYVVEDIDIQQLLEVQFESDDWEVVGLVGRIHGDHYHSANEA